MGFDYISLAPDKFDLPDGWRVCKVQDVAVVNEQSIQRGYKNEWILYIDIASVEKGTVKSMEIIPLKKAPSRARRIVRDKDTLIATVRPNLEHYVFIKEAKPNTIASTGFAVVSAKQVEPRYLYYYLTTPPFTEYLTRIADSHTSTYPAFNPDVIENAELLLPPEDEQRAIAHILGTLDDKIELNRKMNETLEAMARAIFKSWFVDFDPVRAKMEGRKPGLPKEISDLFSDGFEDSELGEIPKGWEMVSFASTVEISGGGTPKTSVPEYWGGDIPWYAVGDAPKESDIFVINTDKKITKSGVENSSTRILPIGTTIISARGTVGKLALTGVPMAMNQTCYGLQGKIHNSAFYTYFSTLTLIATFQQSTHGSVFDTITRDTLTSVKVVMPPSKLIERFDAAVTPLMGHILNNLWQSQTLAAIRDALLPKLISGEIRVNDAEKMVEEVI